MLHVIGIDPGETTGWCRLTIPRDSMYDDEPGRIEEWDYGEFLGPDISQVIEICRLVRETQGLDFAVGPAVVCEDFDLMHENPTTDPVLLTPVRIASMLQYAQFRGDMGPDSLVTLQGRTVAKETATDDRLRHYGLYVKGSDHIRDATRHAWVAIRRAKQSEDVRAAMWADPTRPRAGRVKPFTALANGLLAAARERQ